MSAACLATAVRESQCACIPPLTTKHLRAQAPFQRARHSRSISGSLGRSLSNALGRTLSRGSGLRRSSSGAARAAGTPRREEGTLTQQSGGSLGSPGRRDSAKDCSAAATERSEPRAAACGPGAHATSMEKSMDSGSTARGATAGAAGGDAASPRGQGEREAQAVHARGASLASVHAHARRCAPPRTPPAQGAGVAVLMPCTTQALQGRPCLRSPACRHPHAWEKHTCMLHSMVTSCDMSCSMYLNERAWKAGRFCRMNQMC